MKVVRGLNLLLAMAISFVSCDSKDLKDNRDTQLVEPIDEPQEEDAEAKRFDELALSYDEAFKKYAAECIANTQIVSDELKYFTGFVDADTPFANVAAVQLLCSAESLETLQTIENEILALDATRAEELILKLVTDTGLATHFEESQAGISATVGEGITLGNPIWAESNGASYYVAPFNSTSDGITNITFSLGEQQLQFEVEVYRYSGRQMDDGLDIYTETCAGCHAGEGAVVHSPLVIGTCSDIEIAGAINLGDYAEDPDNLNSRCANKEFSVEHAFDLNGRDTEAVTAYLRSLPLNIDQEQAQ